MILSVLDAVAPPPAAEPRPSPRQEAPEPRRSFASTLSEARRTSEQTARPGPRQTDSHPPSTATPHPTDESTVESQASAPDTAAPTEEATSTQPEDQADPAGDLSTESQPTVTSISDPDAAPAMPIVIAAALPAPTIDEHASTTESKPVMPSSTPIPTVEPLPASSNTLVESNTSESDSEDTAPTAPPSTARPTLPLPADLADPSAESENPARRNPFIDTPAVAATDARPLSPRPTTSDITAPADSPVPATFRTELPLESSADHPSSDGDESDAEGNTSDFRARTADAARSLNAFAETAPAGDSRSTTAQAVIDTAGSAADAQATRPAHPQTPPAAAAQGTLPDGLSNADTDDRRVADQAGRALRAVLNQRGGTVTLRLNPPELGALRVELRIDQQNVRATFDASTEQARAALSQHLSSLKTALTQHGLNVESLTVQQPAPTSHGQLAQDQREGIDDGRSRGSFDQSHSDHPSRRDRSADSQTAFERELVDLLA